MILVADAGSSKIDWAFIEKNEVLRFQTAGTNPSILPNAASIKAIWNEATTQFPKTIQEAHFFGAGCRNEASNIKIKEALNQTFKITGEIEVDSDIIGAAKSLYGANKGNVLILGTGLNTGYYDGSSIPFKTPALGYLLGDEGSGCDIGKTILSRFIRQQLRPELAAILQEFLTTERIPDPIAYIYGQQTPNKAIAGILTAFKAHLNNPDLRDIVRERFDVMIENNCLDYRNFTTEFKAVGSIAYYFNNELKAALNKYNFQLTQVAQSPIEALIKFYS